MANYPAAGASTGYVYDRDFDIPMSAHNNARATGSFTVALAETTTISDARIRSGDVVLITPTNLKAAQLVGGVAPTTLGISVLSVVNGSFVVDHDLNAAAEGSTFFYSVLRNF
jgi:hypothetical protein